MSCMIGMASFGVVLKSEVHDKHRLWKMAVVLEAPMEFIYTQSDSIVKSAKNSIRKVNSALLHCGLAATPETRYF